MRLRDAIGSRCQSSACPNASGFVSQWSRRHGVFRRFSAGAHILSVDEDMRGSGASAQYRACGCRRGRAGPSQDRCGHEQRPPRPRPASDMGRSSQPLAERSPRPAVSEVDASSAWRYAHSCGLKRGHLPLFLAAHVGAASRCLRSRVALTNSITSCRAHQHPCMCCQSHFLCLAYVCAKCVSVCEYVATSDRHVRRLSTSHVCRKPFVHRCMRGQRMGSGCSVPDVLRWVMRLRALQATRRPCFRRRALRRMPSCEVLNRASKRTAFAAQAPLLVRSPSRNGFRP